MSRLWDSAELMSHQNVTPPKISWINVHTTWIFATKTNTRTYMMSPEKKKPSKLSHTEKKTLEANLLIFHQKQTDHIRKTFP